MPLLGVSSQEFLPSIWAEARSKPTLHNERTNIPQIITRSESDAISHNTTGVVNRSTHEVPQTAFRDVDRPRPSNERYPQLPRQNYSPLAKNQSFYHPYDYLSYNYTLAGRGVYKPNPNPVVLDKII